MSTIIDFFYILQENILGHSKVVPDLDLYKKFLLTPLTSYESMDFLEILEVLLASKTKDGMEFVSCLNDISFTLDSCIDTRLLLIFLRTLDNFGIQVLQEQGLFSQELSENFWNMLCNYEADYGGKLFLFFITHTQVSTNQLKNILLLFNNPTTNQEYNLARTKSCYSIDPYKTSKAFLEICKDIDASLPSYDYLYQQTQTMKKNVYDLMISKNCHGAHYILQQFCGCH
jgi:hypothetical protein